MTSQASSSALTHKIHTPHLVNMIKGFPLKVKSFQNTETYQKIWGGVSSTRGLKKKILVEESPKKPKLDSIPQKNGTSAAKAKLSLLNYTCESLLNLSLYRSRCARPVVKHDEKSRLPCYTKQSVFFTPISNISPLSDVTAILSQENKKALYLHG